MLGGLSSIAEILQGLKEGFLSGLAGFKELVDGYLDGLTKGVTGFKDLVDGYLKGIKSGVTDFKDLAAGYWQGVTQGITDFKDLAEGYFDGLIEGVIGIPNAIKEKLEEIFVPDTEEIEGEFTAFLELLQTEFSFDTEFFENLFEDGEPVTDIYTDYTIPGVGEFNLKVFDTEFLVQGVEYFRPFIRGFLVLLMGFYHVHMILGFIRQDAGRVTGLGGKDEK